MIPIIVIGIAVVVGVAFVFVVPFVFVSAIVAPWPEYQRARLKIKTACDDNVKKLQVAAVQWRWKCRLVIDRVMVKND